MSLPGWSMERHINPTISTSIQQLSKSRTWSYRLSSTKPEESKRLWDRPALLLGSLFLQKHKGTFSKAVKTQCKETIDILKMGLNADQRKKILNLRCATHNFQSWTTSRDKYTPCRIYEELLPGLIQLPRQMLVKNRKLEPIVVSYILIIALHCWAVSLRNCLSGPVHDWGWGECVCRKNRASPWRKSRLHRKEFLWLLKTAHPGLKSLFLE